MMAEKHDDVECCGGLITVQADVQNLKMLAAENKKAIQLLQNRLPTWATLALASVMAYAGWVSGVAFGK